ncbi:MAG TPA: hypothetical protein PKD72_02395, partial [Gemmatales bacterium]|nr:hypothetical protein [Gemmatales bacterium]
MAEQRRGENWRGKPAALPQAGSRYSSSSKKKIILSILGGMLVIAGVVAGILLMGSKPVELYGLSIVLNELSDPHWPIPAWARQDGERVMPSGAGAVVVKPLQEQSRSSIIAKLAEAQQNAKDRPALVYLLAGVILQGDEPHLITSDARSYETDRHTLPLGEVLERLRQLPQPCFLVLDLRYSNDPWLTGLGTLDAYEVYAYLDAYYKQQSPERLAVLCYCHAGQPPITQAAWPGSIFAMGLQEALAGHANGWSPARSADLNVTSEEVAYYVKERVAQWLQRSGLPADLPRYHASRDFVLWSAAKPNSATLPISSEIKYPSELMQTWKWLEQRIQNHGADKAPLAQRRLWAALLRAEHRLLHTVTRSASNNEDKRDTAPVAPTSTVAASTVTKPVISPEIRRILDELKPELDRYQLQIASPRKQAAYSVFRLQTAALTEDQQKEFSPLEDVLQKWRDNAPLKHEEWQGLLQSVKDMAGKQPAHAASRIGQILGNLSDAKITHIRRLASLLQLMKEPITLDLEIIRFLDRIPDDQLRYYEPSLKTIITALRWAEQAVPNDPRAWRYVRQSLEKEDLRFQNNLLDVANTDFISTQRSECAKNLLNIQQNYQKLYEIGQAVELALKERDACQAEMPYLAQMDLADTLQATQLQNAWEKWLPSVRQLLNKLQPPEALTLEWANDLRSTAELVQERRLLVLSIRRTHPDKIPYYSTINNLSAAYWYYEERERRLNQALYQSVEAAQSASSPLSQVPTRFMETNPLEAPRITAQQYHRLRRAGDLLSLAQHPEATAMNKSIEELISRYEPATAQKVRRQLGGIWASSVTPLVAS